MNAIVWKDGLGRDSLAEKALSASARFWFFVAVSGQWLFFCYIVGFYGRIAATGNLEALDVFRKLGGIGYVASDPAGNAVFIAHALAAGIIAFGGALQFVPQIRERAPRFHHWNGRVFLVTVLALSFSGIYLVWLSGRNPSLFGSISTTANGLLIITCALFAWHHARARRIAVHRRWALRLYLVSNAQWFLRIGVFAFFIVNFALGRKVSFNDPFLLFWTVGCYLVPLAVAELYLRAKDRGSAGVRLALATGLVAATLVMAVGIVGFSVLTFKIATGAPLAFPGR